MAGRQADSCEICGEMHWVRAHFDDSNGFVQVIKLIIQTHARKHLYGRMNLAFTLREEG